jgi:hypothetical protein
MALQHDNQGFLVGELVESNKDLIAGQNTGNRLLGGIKTDVSAIARVLGVVSRAGGGRSGSRAAVGPVGRGGPSGVRGEGGNATGASGRQSATAQRTGGIGAANARATVSPVGRDSRGRFVAGASAAKDVTGERDGKGRFVGGPGSGEGGSGSGRLLDKLSGVADSLKGLAGGADQMDPSLVALKEVKDVMEPLGRGAFAMFGKSEKQKKERWYNRIWKSLTAIEKKPANGGPGGMPSIDGSDGALAGGVAGLVARFLPALGSALVVALGVIGAAGLGVYIGTKIYEWLDKSGIATKIFDAFDAVSNWFRTKVLTPLGFKPVTPDSDPVNLSKMDKGYRKRADFSGIDGGATMAQNGTYTQAEAQRIRDLKSSGQNTSAFGRGGMTPAVMEKIAAQAKAAGLDPVMMQKIAAMESGGNGNAISQNGAIGLYQFTGQTATGVGIKDRFSADQNIAGGMALTKQNAAFLDKNKLPITAANLYMMHQLGPPAAVEVIKGAQSGALKSAMSPATQKAMNQNFGAQQTTVAGYLNANERAMDSRFASGTGISQAANSTIPRSGVLPKGANLPTATVNAPVPIAPASPMSVPAKLPAMPEISMPSPSTEKDRPLSVTIKHPVGQNVGDRGIANVVTGALGSTAWG